MKTNDKKRFSLKCFFLVPSLLIVSYVIWLAMGGIQSFPESLTDRRFMPFVPDKPVSEDGYYYLTIAWNIGTGKGPVYNFDKVTTGFQPVYVFIQSMMVYFLSKVGIDKWGYAKSVVVFGVLNLMMFAWLIKRITRKLFSGEQLHTNNIAQLSMLIAISSYQLLRFFTSGLETGVYLTMLSWLILITLDIKKNETVEIKKSLLIGLCYGLTALSRIDFNIFFLIFLVVAMTYRYLRLKDIVIICVVSGIIQFYWFYWVYQVSGSWMPSSGGASSALMTFSDGVERLHVMLKAVIDHFNPWVALNSKRGGFLLCGLTAIFVYFFHTGKDSPKVDFDKIEIWLIWLISLSVCVIVYPVFFWSGHFYHRYSSVMLVCLIPILSFLIYKTAYSKYPPVIFPIFFLLLFFMTSFKNFHYGQLDNNHSVSVGFIQSKFSRDIKIGCWQSGATGYFNPNVMNLDGKMDFDALKSQKRNSLHEYIDEQKIDVLIDWPLYINKSLTKQYLANWEDCGFLLQNGSVCLKRKNAN